MKRLILLAMMMVLPQIFCYSINASANSVSYHISVTIPAIVGFNTPEVALATEPTDFTLERTDLAMERTTEYIVRNNQEVLLETYVVD